jgi:hypothetical protein
MTSEELKSISEAVTAALAARQAPPAPPGPGIMPLSTMTPMAAPAGGPIAVAVAVSIPMPDGSEASAYITLDASALSNLPQTIAMLQQQGWPIRTYTPRATGWGRPGWNNRPNYGRSWR